MIELHKPNVKLASAAGAHAALRGVQHIAHIGVR